MIELRYSSTVLFVADIQRSTAFYTKHFSQVIANDFGPCVGFTSGLALWQTDHAAKVTNTSVGSDLVSQRGGAELEFQTVDISAAVAGLKAAGVRLLHDVITQPWQQQAFRCFDPDGHLIEVGEDLAATAQRLQSSGHDVEWIAQAFSMPPKLVQALLVTPLAKE